MNKDVDMNFICTHGMDIEEKCYQCDAENGTSPDYKSIGNDIKKIFWAIFFGFVIIGLLLAVAGA